MKKLFPIVATMLVFALSGCAPQVDVEADAAAINRLLDEDTTALNAGDAVGLVALYTEDVVLMPPDELAVIGKEARRAFLQTFFDQYTLELARSTEEVVVADDWAFARSTQTSTLTPKDGGEPIERSGKVIHIYQRQPDGSWKLARAIWNFDQPAASE